MVQLIVPSVVNHSCQIVNDTILQLLEYDTIATRLYNIQMKLKDFDNKRGKVRIMVLLTFSTFERPH